MNVTAVEWKQKKVRGISQIVQVVPGGDLAPVLGRFRAAVAGCSTPLINQDGTRMKFSLLPDPRGLGAHAITLKSISVNPPGAHGIPLEGVYEIAASGPNAISIGTMGYTSAERAKITARAWNNLVTRP
ncbi:MAG: hypothetical protein M3Y49_07945 [Actinomycetota bacterium]|nr:hypothetical protein [Actinomycetota bacterium]